MPSYSDAALFLAPKQNEVSALAELLTLSRKATGLKIKFHKSTVVPIHYASLNMIDILGQLLAKQTHFPVKYLGLPLITAHLRRIDFQSLVNKIVVKLNGWNGRNLSHAGGSYGLVSSITSGYLFLVSTEAVEIDVGRD